MKKKKKPNFIARFLAVCGKSEVPGIYNLWSAISLLGALLGDRVWIEKFAGKKLIPNLYTMLVGISGGGKGTAIDLVYEIVEQIPEVKLYRGKATGAHLSDYFAQVQAEMEEAGQTGRPSIYLIFPELSMSVGDGPQASDFVKRFTELYTGGSYLHQEGTRTHGKISYRNPIVNCFFGSTADWLYESIPRSAIKSGFFARCAIVNAPFDHTVRIPNPEAPPNFMDLKDWLLRRAKEIAKLKGQFHLTNEAREAHESWYMGRPGPSGEELVPTWRRADDLLRKLAMIVSVSKGRDRLIITSQDMAEAIQLLAQAQDAIPELIRGSQRGPDIEKEDAVAVYIRKHGVISHSTLLKRCSNRGIPAKEVNEHLRALIGQEKIKQVKMKNQPNAQAWKWLADEATLDQGSKEDE